MPYREQGFNSWVMLARSLEFPAEAYEHAGTVMLGLHINIASRFGVFFCFKNAREFFLQFFQKQRSADLRTASNFV